MESSQTSIGPIDRLQLAVFKRQLRAMDGQRSRLQTARVGMAFLSLLAVNAIDTTNTRVDMCMYQLDGTGEGPADILANIEMDFSRGAADMFSGECLPTIE